MSSMNFSSSKQTIKPPQRGIFPLDHDSECKPFMEKYISCLKEEHDKHHLCRDLSKEYLQCRMDRKLMASEDLEKVKFKSMSSIFGSMSMTQAVDCSLIFLVISHFIFQSFCSQLFIVHNKMP
mmetsp:Transcript_33784/g.69414  ORF Transcript_33784/g.69414 Transcript_33784/m.69414 type:complete len:123 (+) Transcript_33784:134-502(+)